MKSRLELSRIAALVAAMCTVACSDNSTSAPPATPRPAPDYAAAVSYCTPLAPTWVAFRDGDGVWTRAVPDVGGTAPTFRHAFSSNRGAIASFTPLFDGAFTVLRVLYGTPAELSSESDTTDADCATGNIKRVQGMVSGIDTTQSVVIAMGRAAARTSVEPRFGLDFTLDGVPSGPQDLLATRVAAGLPPRIILRRDLDLPNGSVLPALDFASGESFDMVRNTLTIDNLGTSGVVNLSVLHTTHGEFFLPIAASGTGPTQPYLAIPASQLRSGDLQQLEVSADAARRTVEVYFRAPVDRTVALGDLIPAPVFSVVGGARARLRARFAFPSGYDRLSTIVYQQPTTTAFVAISVTPSYAAFSGAYDLDVPDLAGVPGFDPSWSLQPGALSYTAFRTGGTLSIGRNPVLFDGATRRTSTVTGTITAP